MKLHHDPDLLKSAIQVTAGTFGIPAEFVEKDYWICQILQRLSRHKHKDKIVWKGGTSLSKAYRLINRFSSDVDFAVLLEGVSPGQQKKLVSRINHDTTVDLEEVHVPGQTVRNNRFRKTYHRYRSVVEEPEADLEFLGSHVIVEINTYGNPYPYLRCEVSPFITDLLREQQREDLIADLDMEPFELNVLDKRRTLCEKVVSLLRFSFEDNPVAGMKSKIRHFYDLHFLSQDRECKEYLIGEFANDMTNLIRHDQEEYDRPPMWRKANVVESILLTDFETLWRSISEVYVNEVGALSYGTLPTSTEIATSMNSLLDRIRTIISNP